MDNMKPLKKELGFLMKMSSMAAAFKKYKGKCQNIKGKSGRSVFLILLSKHVSCDYCRMLGCIPEVQTLL
jgi:hypothetical protein